MHKKVEMNYKPIDCNYYDKIEAWATLNTPCTILYWHENEKKCFENVLINTIYTSNHEEFLVLDTDIHIRLDFIIAINHDYIDSSCNP